jgi:hypothetical protein
MPSFASIARPRAGNAYLSYSQNGMLHEMSKPRANDEITLEMRKL